MWIQPGAHQGSSAREHEQQGDGYLLLVPRLRGHRAPRRAARERSGRRPCSFELRLPRPRALRRARAARTPIGSTSRHAGPIPCPKSWPLAIADSTTPSTRPATNARSGRDEPDHERRDESLHAEQRAGRHRERPARRGGDRDHDRERADEPEREPDEPGRAGRRRSGRPRRRRRSPAGPRPKRVRWIT